MLDTSSNSSSPSKEPVVVANEPTSPTKSVKSVTSDKDNTSTQGGSSPKKEKAAAQPKSLDTINLDAITVKDLAKKKHNLHIPAGKARLFSSLPKAAFAIFDSPRTLQALAEEGVDPQESLLHRDYKDFLRLSRGDATCAQIRYDHYEKKRTEVLETLRKRRQRIIDREQERQKQTNEEYSVQRPVRTPTVQATEELTGVLPPPRSEQRQRTSERRSRSGAADRKADSSIRTTSNNDDAKERSTVTTSLSATAVEVVADDDEKASKSPKDSGSHQKDHQQRQGSPAGASELTSGDEEGTYSDDDSDDDVTTTTSSQRRKQDELIGDPDEFRKRQAEAKKAKVLRQAQKMREVMAANAKRQKQKEEVMEKILKQREEREADLAKKKRRQEIERRTKEAAARKREAELRVLKEKREEQMQAKQDELHNERVQKLQEFEEREERRREKEAAEQEALNIKRAKKRHRVALRALAIHEYSEKVANDQKQKLLDRMAKADEVREELNETKEKELEEKRKEIERQTAENKKKRERAEEQFKSKITRYIEKAETAEEHRKAMEKEKEDYFLFRSLQEKDKEKKRQEITEQVRREEKEKSLELLRQLEAAELHCAEVQEMKQAEMRVKAAKHNLILEDRREKVRQMQRMVQYSIDEAERAYDEKITRIEAMQRDAKEADEHRKLLQYKTAKYAQKMAERNKRQAMLTAAPGPLDYGAVEAERFLHGPGTGVRMGAAPHVSKRVDIAPGPGAYGAPYQTKKVKGGILPPKDIVGIADVQKLIAKRKEKEKEKVLNASKRANSTLPAIDGSGSNRNNATRSDSAPLSKTAPAGSSKAGGKSVKISESNNNTSTAREETTTGRTVDHPADLQEEDFCSSDEYETASDMSDV